MNITESPSKYDHLEQKSILEILQGINAEDKTVPFAVEKAIPQIEKLVCEIVSRMRLGGRLFYIGAGTSGRLGIVMLRSVRLLLAYLTIGLLVL